MLTRFSHPRRETTGAGGSLLGYRDRDGIPRTCAALANLGQTGWVEIRAIRDNVELSVAFYGATLGFEPPESWSPDGYVALRADVVVIDVQHHSKLPPGHHFGPSRLTGPRGVGIEIVVEVEDVHLAYVRLMSGQIRSEQPRKRAGVAGSQNLLLTSHGVFATSDSSIPMGTTYGSRRAVGNRTGNAASTTDRRQ